MTQPSRPKFTAHSLLAPAAAAYPIRMSASQRLAFPAPCVPERADASAQPGQNRAAGARMSDLTHNPIPPALLDLGRMLPLLGPNKTAAKMPPPGEKTTHMGPLKG